MLDALKDLLCLKLCWHKICTSNIGVPFPSELELETAQDMSVAESPVVESGVSVQHYGLFDLVMHASFAAVGCRGEHEDKND